MEPLMATLRIDGLNRDPLKKRSIVMLKWEDDPEKRLGLLVPFDCTLDNLRAEAEKVVRALATAFDPKRTWDLLCRGALRR